MKLLPGDNNKKKALLLSRAVMVRPILDGSYQVSCESVGDPETIYYRQGLYVGYIAISGFTALVLGIAWKRLRDTKAKNIIIPLIYVGVMGATYVGLPPNPNEISISMELIQTFRIWTAITISVFWGVLAMVFGSLWDRFIRHEEPRIATLY